MGKLCNCPATLGNTGRPECVSLLDITKYMFIVNTFASDGTRNGILLTDTVDAAYITARVNDPDPTKRWYPTLKLAMVEDVRAEPVTEEIDGVNIITEDGTRTFVGHSPKASQVYLAKLKSGQCARLSVFNGDDSNRLSGTVSADGLTFLPHMIEDGTFYASLTKAQRGVTQKVSIQFAYASSEKDEDIDMFQTDADLAAMTATGGLLDIYATPSAASLTGFTADITHQYGTANSPGKVTGLELADFALYNATGMASVVILTLTETSDGVYTFTFASQAAASKLVLTSAKDGVYLNSEITLP